MREEISNRLLGFLRASFRAVGEAHRTNARHEASTPARLSWEVGADWKSVRARLVDISRAGAGLVVAVEPPSTPRARLRLVGHETTPWIEAEILGSDPLPRGRHRVRLKFADPCPSYFLRVAVLGHVPVDDGGVPIEAMEAHASR